MPTITEVCEKGAVEVGNLGEGDERERVVCFEPPGTQDTGTSTQRTVTEALMTLGQLKADFARKSKKVKKVVFRYSRADGPILVAASSSKENG